MLFYIHKNGDVTFDDTLKQACKPNYSRISIFKKTDFRNPSLVVFNN